MTTDPHWLRQQLLVALAADDDLFAMLTLKGGNALALVHKIGHRTSLDLDYSLRDDVAREILEPRIFAALRRRLAEKGLHLFDEQFAPRPESPTEPRWGGYRVEFKVIEGKTAQNLTVESARRLAVRVEPNEQATVKWRIEISRQEAIPEHEELLIAEGFTCRVYTKPLIAAEKLRALCQQMNEYPHRAHPTPRPRDFYDLHALATEGQVDLAGEHLVALLPPVFSAKDVPIELLRQIPAHASFHAEDWDRVRNNIPADRPRDFSFYERFVSTELQRLYKVFGW
jgi:hypothetical protein